MGHDYSKELAAMGDQMKSMSKVLVQSQATLTTMQNRITEKENDLQVMTENKAKSDIELAAAQAELAGLRSSANDKENKLQVMIQNQEKSEEKLLAARADLARLRLTVSEERANVKMQIAELKETLIFEYTGSFDNMKAYAEGESKLSVKRESIIKLITLELHKLFKLVEDWDIDGGSAETGKILFKFVDLQIDSLEMEIKDVIPLVSNMNMDAKLKEKYLADLNSFLDLAKALSAEIEIVRRAVSKKPESVTIVGLKRCVTDLDKAVRAFPAIKTTAQYIEERKEMLQKFMKNEFSRINNGQREQQ